MKITTININFFKVMDDIRDTHGITITDWAKSANMEISRISELRQRKKLAAAGIYKPTGRAFTSQKSVQLYEGLKELLKGKGVSLRDEVRRKIKNEEDALTRVQIKISLIENEKNLKHIEKTLDLLLGTEEIEKK